MRKKRKKGKAKLTPLGKAIKKKLVDKGMTQKQLAEELGASETYLCDIFIGRRTGEKYLERMAQILKIDVTRYIKNKAA